MTHAADANPKPVALRHGVWPSVIAIDGPAASGKSTIGELLAEHLGYLYFDTGVMYRAITWVALERSIAIDDEAAVTQLAQTVAIDLLPSTVDDGRQNTIVADGDDITWSIRRPEVDRSVSKVSAYPGVRAAMSAQQRRIATRGQIVMVGRDIGTVVLPDADLKIYLDATPEERARRRWLEEQVRGARRSYDVVLADVRRRDGIDSTRAVAPLRPAADAVILDSTDLDVEQVLSVALALVEGRTGEGPG